MTGFEVFEYYCSLKAHFHTESYDFFKYNKKVGMKMSSYQKRNDKTFFEWLGKKKSNRDIIPYLLATFITNKNVWIGDLNNIDAETNYTSWRSRIDSLSKTFENDLEFLFTLIDKKQKRFKDLFLIESNHPMILKLVVGNHITLETFIIINDIANFVVIFDKKLKDDLLWSEYRLLVLKYRPFLTINKEKYKKILQNYSL